MNDKRLDWTLCPCGSKDAPDAEETRERRNGGMRKIMYALSAIALGGLLAAAAVAMDPYPDVVFGARQSSSAVSAFVETDERAELIWHAAQTAVQSEFSGGQ